MKNFFANKIVRVFFVLSFVAALGVIALTLTGNGNSNSNVPPNLPTETPTDNSQSATVNTSGEVAGISTVVGTTDTDVKVPETVTVAVTTTEKSPETTVSSTTTTTATATATTKVTTTVKWVTSPVIEEYVDAKELRKTITTTSVNEPVSTLKESEKTLHKDLNLQTIYNQNADLIEKYRKHYIGSYFFDIGYTSQYPFYHENLLVLPKASKELKLLNQNPITGEIFVYDDFYFETTLGNSYQTQDGIVTETINHKLYLNYKVTEVTKGQFVLTLGSIRLDKNYSSTDINQNRSDIVTYPALTMPSEFSYKIADDNFLNETDDGVGIIIGHNYKMVIPKKYVSSAVSEQLFELFLNNNKLWSPQEYSFYYNIFTNVYEVAGKEYLLFSVYEDGALQSIYGFFGNENSLTPTSAAEVISLINHGARSYEEHYPIHIQKNNITTDMMKNITTAVIPSFGFSGEKENYIKYTILTTHFIANRSTWDPLKTKLFRLSVLDFIE